MPGTALLTDHYELTMLQASLADGTADRHCVFEVFTRRLPPGRRYGVVAGIGRLLDAVAEFRFTDADLAFLQGSGVVDAATAAWLANYRFGGDLWGYAEGEVFFPYSPILIAEGTFAETVLLETVILSILNHDCAVAAAASRMVNAAAGRPCLDMGSRRTHEEAAVAAARAAFVAGFTGTSNLAAGARYGLPTKGTAAHAFTLLHDTEAEAFAAQVASLGTDTTLLIDTYDVMAGVRQAVATAGPDLGAVRIDSGDLGAESRRIRALLDELGAEQTKVVATSDLDEFLITELREDPVDVFGVGTQLVTGSGAPTTSLVFKLVARSDDPGRDAPLRPVWKRSESKGSVGGRKQAFRRIVDGTAASEVLVVDAHQPPELPGEYRQLLVPLLKSGERLGSDDLAAAQVRHRAAVAELPPEALQVTPGPAAIPTEHY